MIFSPSRPLQLTDCSVYWTAGHGFVLQDQAYDIYPSKIYGLIVYGRDINGHRIAVYPPGLGPGSNDVALGRTPPEDVIIACGMWLGNNMGVELYQFLNMVLDTDQPCETY